MNIVYISKYVVLPEFGSPTRQYFISKYLSKLPGNEVLLIGSRSSLTNIPKFKKLYICKKNGQLETVTLNGPKINLGFNLKRIWSWIIFEINILRFKNKIELFKPDVLIVSSLSILTFLSGVFLKKWLNVPLVIEIRDIYPLTLQEIGNYSSLNPFIIFLKWVEKTGYKNADLLISTLPNAREHIANILKKPFQFNWLPMGIDPDFFKLTENIESKDLFSRKTGDFIIAYAGTLGKANALDIIFEAAKVLQTSHPHIRFVFIGNGPLKSFYQEKYKNLERVEFIPPVPKENLPNLLKQADALINTWLDKPIYKFGISPNKWMDYMFAAKPMLVAFSGYRSILNEAECGKFIPAENKDELVKAIIQFSETDVDILKQMGINGRNYLLKNLTYEYIAADFNKELLLLKK